MEKINLASKRIQCIECGFKVESHDSEEVAELAYQHLKKFHPGKKLSKEEVMASIETF